MPARRKKQSATQSNEGLLFWRKEAIEFYVAIAVLSDSVRHHNKSFLVLIFKKELFVLLLIGSTQIELVSVA